MRSPRAVKVLVLVLIAAVFLYGQQPVTVVNTVNLGTTNGGAGQLALNATLTGGTAEFQMFDGTNVIGTAAHPVQVSLANTAANGTAVSVSFAAGNTISLVPVTSGGLTMKHFVAAASDNATFAKASAGQVYNVDVFNNAGYPVYFKLYNQTTAPSTCGTATVVKTIGVQAGTARSFDSEQGLAFSTGIAYCLVKGITDADDTSVVLSDAVVDISYK